MVIVRGEIWWAELDEPAGSGPGYRRPVLIIQSDAFNRSRIGTVVVAALTSNMRLGDVPGNVILQPDESHLPRECVINVSQILTLDRRFLAERVGEVPRNILDRVEDGLRLVLSL
jgi:mRNA interferase MazF